MAGLADQASIVNNMHVDAMAKYALRIRQQLNYGGAHRGRRHRGQEAAVRHLGERRQRRQQDGLHGRRRQDTGVVYAQKYLQHHEVN